MGQIKLEVCAMCGYIKENCKCKKKQTYDDRLNAMTPEEKAEFFANFSVEKIVGEWCTKLCPQRLAGAEECDCPYEVKQSIEGWLKAEVKEDV